MTTHSKTPTPCLPSVLVQEGGRTGEDARSIVEVCHSIDRRFASEQKRYAELYGVDPTDPLNFDLVVNTKYNDLGTVTAIVLAAFRAWRETGREA